MSNKVTMTVIYFTDGALIEDLHVRKSMLRIPEIIQCLREHQNEFLNCDLFIAMMDQKVFNLLNYWYYLVGRAADLCWLCSWQ